MSVLMNHCDLLNALQMRSSEDVEDELEEIIQEFELKNSRTLLHTTLFY